MTEALNSDRILRGDHCRCTACGEHFNSTKAFDKHRRGEYIARRCLNVDEMRAAGMSTNADQWWITSADPRADGRLRRDDWSGDQGEEAPEVRPAA